MRHVLRTIVLVAALCTAVGLGGCLPDDRDPDKTAQGSGQLTGAFYGSGLGSVALAIQNIIVTQSNWFTNVHSGDVDMAAMGIASTGMGVSVKSFLCTMPGGQTVRQLTWIDERDGANKFALRGIGDDAGAIVGSLRNRVAGNQVGIYKGGSTIEMVDGSSFSTASMGCPTAPPIPVGAPVLAFDIDRPALPTAALARTEYRTMACENDATGRQMRGTRVQSRTVTYGPDGAISPSDPNAGWTNDANSMGQCMNDVVVEITQREFHAGKGAVDMDNFAAIALRDLLRQQLQMDCTNTTVRGDMAKRGERFNKSKAIDTCPLAVNVTGLDAVTEDEDDNAVDEKRLYCKGITPEILVEFKNIVASLRRTAWTDGYGDLVRVVDNRTNDTVGGNSGQYGTGQQGQRDHWIGTTINCTGYQSFFVECAKIPGNPPVQERVSNEKFKVENLDGYRKRRNWLDGLFGICGFFGSCVRLEYGEVFNLNPDYFTGTTQLENAGTTSYRNMKVDGWLDRYKFIPNAVPATIWRITDNQCLWSQRVMTADCPFTYDPGRQGEWTMTSVSAATGRPVALDPGIAVDGSDAANIYKDARADGKLTALVVLHWKKTNFKGTKRWDESFGPGKNAYIKAWTNIVPTTDIVLTAEQVEHRNNMCSDIRYQLDAHALHVKWDKIQMTDRIDRDRKQLTYNTLAREVAETEEAIQNYEEAADDAYEAYVNNTDASDYYAQQASDAYQYADDLAASQRLICVRHGVPPAPDQPAPCEEEAYSPSDATINGAYSGANYLSTQSSNYATAAGNSYKSYTSNTNAANNLRNNVLPGQRTSMNNAGEILDKAKEKFRISYEQYIEARDKDLEHLQHPLTDEEVTALSQVQSQTCTSSSGVLDEGSQENYKATCAQYYNDPGAFSTIPSMGNFCDNTFTGNADELEFLAGKIEQTGLDVQTTLLNREGVDLAWRPQLDGNEAPGADTFLNTKQRGFVTPLMCARSEYEYIPWPVTRSYVSCGGKGGCRVNYVNTTCTVIKSTAREWSGLSYETGTWSQPQTLYMASWGANYTDANQIPRPYATSTDCNIMPAPPPPPPPPPPPVPDCLMAQAWSGWASTSVAILQPADPNARTYQVVDVVALDINKWNSAPNAQVAPSRVINLPFSNGQRSANSILNEGYKMCPNGGVNPSDPPVEETFNYDSCWVVATSGGGMCDGNYGYDITYGQAVNDGILSRCPVIGTSGSAGESRPECIARFGQPIYDIATGSTQNPDLRNERELLRENEMLR